MGKRLQTPSAAPDKVLAACCGIDVASAEVPHSASAEAIVDPTDFADEIVYDVDGLFDGLAKPMPFTFKGKERFHLRHHFLNPRQPQTLEGIKAEFARAKPGEVLGVVTHEMDFARAPAFIEEWFKFVRAQGVRAQTVRDIASTRGDGR